MQPGPLNAASLPPDTEVGPWRIVDARGCGAFGAVYLAKGKPGFVALKLALHPRDARFGREVELLSRIRSPAVPRLIDHGQWRSHPYLVMQWLEGIPLYEWAHARAPSSRQVLRVLASLARALEATHAARGVHRDVRGGNVLVRLKDGQPFLIDFGAGSYEAATPLTGPVFPPGTRQYRAPEAIRFAVHIQQSPIKVYAPKPADDVFAVGVTAYHLVTGEYPPTADPLDEEAHVWDAEGTGPRPARELNPRCSPELSAVISRMLSLRPEDRGSAGELAAALEKAARKAGRAAEVSLFPTKASAPVEAETAPLWPFLLAAGFAGAVMLGTAWWMNRPGEAGFEPPVQVAEHQEEARDAGSVAVGDTALVSQEAPTREPSSWTPITVDLPKKPLPGQVRPDASGRCPDKQLVSINGGCWAETKAGSKNCGRYTYSYEGACYVPIMQQPPPATSAPAEARDGG